MNIKGGICNGDIFKYFLNKGVFFFSEFNYILCKENKLLLFFKYII